MSMPILSLVKRLLVYFKKFDHKNQSVLVDNVVDSIQISSSSCSDHAKIPEAARSTVVTQEPHQKSLQTSRFSGPNQAEPIASIDMTLILKVAQFCVSNGPVEHNNPNAQKQ